MLDLLVIGAGLAGLTAAYTAAKAGLRVCVIAKGMGTTHWSAGTVDVLGYYPNSSAEPVQRPLENVQTLIEAQPEHPYALLGTAQLSDALKAFAVLTGEISLPYAGAANGGENLLLPSPAGAPRPTFLAPLTQRAGDLSHPDPFLIVGFRGLGDFFPELIAANLCELGYDARAAFLPIDLITDRQDFNTVQLATELENRGRRSRLAAELKRLVQPGERIGLPAILGLDDHLAVLADLQAQVSASVFEIPTLPPSVPGIRLHKALCRRLEELGVRVEAGMEVVGFRSGGQARARFGSPQQVEGFVQSPIPNPKSEIRNPKSLLWVASETTARPLKHHAANFLLATGGILGGGFDSDYTGRVWETIFDLPLTTPQKRSEWFRPKFLDPAGHPVYRGGVRVNKQFQPVKADGAPVYENLWAAGGCLAQADPIHERSLEGIAITTSVAAAQQIVGSGWARGGRGSGSLR
ncbi:MAG: Anaerobic glycerol-3-phosphate dehydrogenase subunit B [Anaerolineales bacterium]|nr:Anaerobic glycerol-3-phosphate dehydrogenase subunit B [Anaerolineales bacterium]